MRWPRPKSLNSLLLTGFALVSVPLLLAVVIGATKVRDLARQSETLVRTGVETTHYTQQLFQQIAATERSVKLYQVLNDPTLLQVYAETRERLLETIANIEAVADDPLRTAHLNALRAALGRVDGALSGATRATRTLEPATDAIDALWKAA